MGAGAHQKQPLRLKVCTASQHISFCLFVSMLFGALKEAQWKSLCDSSVHSSRLCSVKSRGCGATRADAKDKIHSSRIVRVLHCSLIPMVQLKQLSQCFLRLSKGFVRCRAPVHKDDSHDGTFAQALVQHSWKIKFRVHDGHQLVSLVPLAYLNREEGLRAAETCTDTGEEPGPRQQVRPRFQSKPNPDSRRKLA